MKLPLFFAAAAWAAQATAVISAMDTALLNIVEPLLDPARALGAGLQSRKGTSAPPLTAVPTRIGRGATSTKKRDNTGMLIGESTAAKSRTSATTQVSPGPSTQIAL